MLFHPPLCLVKAVLYRMPHAGEAFQVWRVKGKERGVFSRFYHQGIFQAYHSVCMPLLTELLFGNAASFNNAPQRAQWQLLSFVIGDNYLFAGIIIPPLLVAAPL